MNRTIDLNSDVGENPETLADGTEEKLIGLISSANIACGGHIGDEQSMAAVMKMCANCGVAIGAHPSYPDRESFGRKKLNIPLDQVSQFVFEQVRDFCRLSSSFGYEVNHIKPHGALYNAAANDQELALAICQGIQKVSRHFILFGLSGSTMLDVWRNEGFKVAAEAFADRRYENDGSLRSRQHADALITDSRLAAAQALRIAMEGKVTTVDGSEIKVPAQTICLHSDTPGALQNASAVRAILLREHIRIEPITPRKGI